MNVVFSVDLAYDSTACEILTDTPEHSSYMMVHPINSTVRTAARAPPLPLAGGRDRCNPSAWLLSMTV